MEIKELINTIADCAKKVRSVLTPGFEEKVYADVVAAHRDFYEKFWGKFRADAERFGGAFELRTYSKGEHAWWWDVMWESDEFWAWCFGKKSNGELEVGK